jgi:phage-related protein
MEHEKEIRWIGSAYGDLLEFPDDARRQAGFQLGKVQAGVDPDDWKPFDDVGAGTREIRIRAMSRQDRGIAETRYRAVVHTRKVRK